MKYISFKSFVLLLALALTTRAAPSSSLSSASLEKIRFQQRLHESISLDLTFQDEWGKPVQLRDFFGKTPVILVLGYYGCPMLCHLVGNGLIEGLQGLQWNAGEQFELIFVSINPSETPERAASKKQSYLRLYGREGTESGWHFLVGEETAIRQLADQVGFAYAYDPAIQQYAHPSGLVILTPQGRIAAYLFGITYPAKELHQALQTASKGQTGSRVREWVLLCFHYAPLTGKYSAFTMNLLRGAAVLTVGILAGGILLLIRRERLRRKPKSVYGKYPWGLR